MIIDSKSLSLEEMVYKRLEDEILSGKLPRGKALGEISLAKRLGVSRTPIRGALHRLWEDGLVEILPNKGATVLGINANDLVDIYRLRERLEGLASSLAAVRITEDELKQLTDAVETAEANVNNKDTESLKELDTVFHSIIYGASGSRFLAKTLSELHGKIRSYRKRSLGVPGRLEKSASEHREILEAIRSGNAEEADRLTSLHVQRALKNMLCTIENN